MIEDIKECAAFGESRGVIIGLQNHNEFITTREQFEYLRNEVKSEWFGLVLDVLGKEIRFRRFKRQFLMQ